MFLAEINYMGHPLKVQMKQRAWLAKAPQVKRKDILYIVQCQWCCMSFRYGMPITFLRLFYHLPIDWASLPGIQTSLFPSCFKVMYMWDKSGQKNVRLRARLAWYIWSYC